VAIGVGTRFWGCTGLRVVVEPLAGQLAVCRCRRPLHHTDRAGYGRSSRHRAAPLSMRSPTSWRWRSQSWRARLAASCSAAK